MTLQNQAQSMANHGRFLARVVARGVVWGLKSSTGWASCKSNEVEGAEVMPFWSDKAYAKRAAQAEWSQCVPTSIPFDDFVAHWLRGMHKDGLLVGTNWDASNAGMEIDPVELALALKEMVDKRGGRPTTG